MALALGVSFSAAETLDRVIASVGNSAITQSNVDRQYRFEHFLNGQWPAPPPESKSIEQVRERLIAQKLLLQEEPAEASRDAGLEKAAAEQLDAVRTRFRTRQDYESALHLLGMDEKEVLAALVDQQKILRIIDQRLRPAAAPATTDVESYYRDVFTPEYTRTHGPPVPPLADVEGQIQEILVQQRIDQLLASWLEELRPSRRVRSHSF